jgi:AhpD family alkylhydroperoxidase
MMKKVVKHRLDVWKEEPLYWELMSGMDKRLYESTISKSLIDLIKVRVSQSNKCAFCIDYHSEDALQHGETQRRIFALSAWQGVLKKSAIECFRY